jgi:hypothetical protein
MICNSKKDTKNLKGQSVILIIKTSAFYFFFQQFVSNFVPPQKKDSTCKTGLIAARMGKQNKNVFLRQ